MCAVPNMAVFCSSLTAWVITSIFVAQQPNSGLGRSIVKVRRSHTIRHMQARTHSSSQRPPCLHKDNKHNRRTSMPSTTNPATKWLQTYALHTARPLGLQHHWSVYFPHLLQTLHSAIKRKYFPKCKFSIICYVTEMRNITRKYFIYKIT
jgi:hypothetical protein